MDATDVRIFCEMAYGAASFSGVQHRNISPSGIGRRIGVNEKTVRLRVKRLESEGFIKYYQAVPNLALFGLEQVASFRLAAFNLPTKRRLIDRIQRTPFLVELVDFFGNSVSVTAAGPDAADADRVVAGLVSEFELKSQELSHRPTGRVRTRLDTLDWRIVKELRFSAMRGASEVADALKVTSRMVEYRIDRLLESGAVSVRAVIDPKKQAGLIFYELELSANPERHPPLSSRLNSLFGEKLWATLPTRDSLVASMFSFSLGEVEEAAAAAGELEGVRYCLPFLLKETIEPHEPNWIDGLIEERL